MIGSKLYTELGDRNLIVDFFKDASNKRVRRITFFDEDEYGCGINLYFMSKKEFISQTDALVCGWLKQYLWEEDMENILPLNDVSASKIYDEAFHLEQMKYKFHPMNEKELKKIISKDIKPLSEKTRAVQIAAGESDDVEFLSEPGVYVDKKYTLKNAYIFKNGESYIDGVFLSRHKDVSGNISSEVFFETDRKYVFIIK